MNALDAMKGIGKPLIFALLPSGVRAELIGFPDGSVAICEVRRTLGVWEPFEFEEAIRTYTLRLGGGPISSGVGIRDREGVKRAIPSA
jgi:hypothetical protein